MTTDSLGLESYAGRAQRCAEVLSHRLTTSGAVVATEDQGVLAGALDYLSVSVVSPPATPDTLISAARRSSVDPMEVLRVLPFVREAIRFRAFIGEWIRGEVVLEQPLPRRAGIQRDAEVVLRGPPEVDIAVVPYQEEADSSDWKRRTRELFGNVFRRLPGRSFTGTPGVVNYVNKDESPE